ncbi:MAG: glutamate--tRNA ligase family protein, partial [Luteolibacter sp.]
AHPIEDALEHITHSLCTLEFENHRPLYDWIIEHCTLPSKPRQIEFARLNLSYTVMSKRKLLKLVQDGHVRGWDDPRLLTISGMRRRGYPAAAIRSFCKRIGITKFNGTTDVALLEHEVRDFLNREAARRMAVLDPVKVELVNWDAEPVERVLVPNHPQVSEMGVREVVIGREILIEKADFMVDPPKKFFRLGPGRCVRLRGGHIIRHLDHELDENGEVKLIRAEIIPGTIGQDAPEGVVCKAAIHWVDAATAVAGEVRIYDRLFAVENPDDAEGGYLEALNAGSLETRVAMLEPALAAAAAGESFQFERIGYFVADCKEHVPGRAAIFNRTVALKDSWARMSS